MFREYLEKLRRSGRRHFSLQEIMNDLEISNTAARSGLYRLNRGNKVISPVKGLYVIVPPEHQPHGCIPAEELVPIMMNCLNANYYVGLLSAAAFYGAAHQKIFKFQIITNSRIVHPLEFGQIKIEVLAKKNISNLPIKNFTVNTGYLKVATPELVAIDLLAYMPRCGGLNHVVTVLSELVESIDVEKLIKLSEKINTVYQLQRIGYILENVEVIDDSKRDEVISKIDEYLSDKIKRYVPLASNISGTGYSRCKKWKIIENIEIESDL
jgi:predicted transcriptional regulator of viral defense system